jgi:hypothetical protein
MKQLIVTILILVLFSACSSRNYISTTTINPQKTFVLGKGKHGSYKAFIENACTVPVAVYEGNLDSTEKFIVLLEPGVTQTLNVAADKKAIFKNNSLQQAVIKLRLNTTLQTGSLSMGYTSQ